MYDVKPDTLLRYAKPQSSWLPNVLPAIQEEVTDLGGWGSFLLAAVFVLIFVIPISILLSLALEIIWHPLFYVIPALCVWPVASVLTFGAYANARQEDADMLDLGTRMIDADLNAKHSILFASKETRERIVPIMNLDGYDQATRRSTLMRLAALLVDHQLTTDPSDKAAAEETARAADAIVAEAAKLPTPRVPVRLEKKAIRPPRMVQQILGKDIETFQSPGTRAGEERADALIMIAEEALADEPDLSDATGSRIDDLVRKHLPALAASRAAAIRHAGPGDRKIAEQMYDQGLKKVSDSVEEALKESQHRRSDELATRVRFLALRRGESDLDVDNRSAATPPSGKRGIASIFMNRVGAK